MEVSVFVGFQDGFILQKGLKFFQEGVGDLRNIQRVSFNEPFDGMEGGDIVASGPWGHCGGLLLDKVQEVQFEAIFLFDGLFDILDDLIGAHLLSRYTQGVELRSEFANHICELIDEDLVFQLKAFGQIGGRDIDSGIHSTDGSFVGDSNGDAHCSIFSFPVFRDFVSKSSHIMYKQCINIWYKMHLHSVYG